MNAMEHGNEYREDRPVSILVRRDARSIRVAVTDHGSHRDFVAAESPDIEAKLEGRQTPRGWGLFLIEKMVDELRTTVGDDLHTLELTVHLKEATHDDR